MTIKKTSLLMIRDNHHESLAKALWERVSVLIREPSLSIFSALMNKWDQISDEEKRIVLKSFIRILRKKDIAKRVQEVLETSNFIHLLNNKSKSEVLKEISRLTQEINNNIQCSVNRRFFSLFKGWEEIVWYQEDGFIFKCVELQAHLLKNKKKVVTLKEIQEAIEPLLYDQIHEQEDD